MNNTLYFVNFYIKKELRLSTNILIFFQESKKTIELEGKMKHLYDTLLHHKNSEGAPLIGPFLKVPCKKTYPDYYESVKNPIDMEIIDNRLKSNYYKTLEDFGADVDLMLENCKTYNRPTSKLFIDGQKLQRIFKNEFTKCQENLPLHPEGDELPILFLHEVHNWLRLFLIIELLFFSKFN